MYNKPLTKEQLVNADTCPRHGCELLMEEYDNPDTAMLCPKCEEELDAMTERLPVVQYSRLSKHTFVAADNTIIAPYYVFDSHKEAMKFWAMLTKRAVKKMQARAAA